MSFVLPTVGLMESSWRNLLDSSDQTISLWKSGLLKLAFGTPINYYAGSIVHGRSWLAALHYLSHQLEFHSKWFPGPLEILQQIVRQLLNSRPHFWSSYHALEPYTQCQIRLVSVLLMPSWNVVLCPYQERQGLDPHALKYQMIDNELQMRPCV